MEVSFKNNGMQNKMNIDDLNDDPAIANYLASSFKSACTPNDEQKENEFRNKYFSTKAKNIGKESSFIIDVESVDRSINRIACNKAAGFDSVSIENIKYAHPSLVIILNTFFNILLFTGLVPDDFGTGVTTPIPKFKGNKKSANADDFRGITICPVISKVFEHCLKEHFENINTSIRQFGFKEGVGCNNSLHSVRKVVRYFNNRKSTVNLGIIDLRKAFDKVNTYGLLCMLQDKNVDIKIINVIENWLSKSSTVIKWGKVFSDSVPLLSGVKQGGILSPLLFTLFVDIVLAKLEDSGLGCFINFTCYNSFMYADDIILLGITVTDLQQMFNLCFDVFKDLDLPINISKCHCLRIGPRCNVRCSAITLQDSIIPWVENTKFLGVTLFRAKYFKCDWSESKGKFYCSVNIILGRLGTSASASVLLKLLNSQGVPNLLYGIAATTLCEIELRSFIFAYNSMFAKVFKTFDPYTISCCQYYCGYFSFNLLYDQHRYLFLKKLINNAYLHKASSLDNLDYKDFVALQSKYNFNRGDSNATIKRKVWLFFEQQINIGNLL